jgi:hypothetical protein
MRKLLTLFAALLVTAGAFAQSAYKIVSPERATQVASPVILDLNVDESSASTAKIDPTNVPQYSSSAVTSVNIASASNAFTHLRVEDHALQAVPGIGTNGGSLSFFHRSNTTIHGGSSGNLRYAISVDGGTTWTSELGPVNPTLSYVARYPNGILGMKPGGTTTADLAVVSASATLDATWDGHMQGLVTSPTTASFVLAQEDYVYNGEGVYIPGSLTERVPGEYWYIDRSYDGTSLTDDITIYKGVYNSGTNKVDWVLNQTMTPNWFKGFDGTATFTSLNIAFSPNGTIGYVGFLGDLVGGVDTVYQPVFAEWNSTTTLFDAPYEFDMSQFSQLYDSLTFFVALDSIGPGMFDTIPIGTGKATTGFDADLTIDANGNPHLFSIVGNASSNFASAGNTAGYSIYSGIILMGFDFTKDEYGDWNMLYIASQSTFRGSFGVGGGSSTVTADPWTQISRTADGTTIFYSWTDSDSTSPAWDSGNSNGFPNQLGRAYSVYTAGSNKLTPVINWTAGDALWDGAAIMPKTSQTAFTNTTCGDYKVPTVIIRLDANDAAAVCSFHFFQDICYNNSQLTEDPKFFFNCKSTPFTNNAAITDPSCGNSDGSITITAGGGTGPYTYLWDNGNTTNALTALAAGLYTGTVTDVNGCSETITFALNNAGAATLAISGANDPSCFGATDGAATVTPTGGTGPFTYLWSNGETTAAASMLPAGSSSVTVTDAGGCQSFSSVSLNAPAQIVLNFSSADVLCNGDANGTASVSASGGAGGFTYSWSDGGSGATRNDLAAGSYTLTVTDANGCNEMVPFTIAEPASISLSSSATMSSTGTPPCTGTANTSATGGSAPFTYAWSNGQTGNFIFALCPGTYTVTVTDANGCTATDMVTVTGPTSIDDELGAGINGLNLFPNPANGSFTLRLNLDKVDNLTVELISMNGQQVLSRTASNVNRFDESINVSGIAAGMYMLKMTTSQGSATRKVIIE